MDLPIDPTQNEASPQELIQALPELPEFDDFSDDVGPLVGLIDAVERRPNSLLGTSAVACQVVGEIVPVESASVQAF